MNNNKVYGGSALGGGVAEGTNKFWRNILGGVASTRFHRPGPRDGYFSIGLNELAQTQIRSARMFQEKFDVFRAEPDVDSELLSHRDENEAYLAYSPGEQYAVFFPDGGSVRLHANISEAMTVEWLEIDKSRWYSGEITLVDDALLLETPGNGQWIVLIK